MDVYKTASYHYLAKYFFKTNSENPRFSCERSLLNTCTVGVVMPGLFLGLSQGRNNAPFPMPN